MNILNIYFCPKGMQTKVGSGMSASETMWKRSKVESSGEKRAKLEDSLDMSQMATFASYKFCIGNVLLISVTRCIYYTLMHIQDASGRMQPSNLYSNVSQQPTSLHCREEDALLSIWLSQTQRCNITGIGKLHVDDKN